MRFMSLPLTGIALAAALAASACTSERMAQNVYEEIRNRNDSLKTPQEKASEPPPQSYPDYEKERQGHGRWQSGSARYFKSSPPPQDATASPVSVSPILCT